MHSWRDERKPIVDRDVIVEFHVGSGARGTDSQQQETAQEMIDPLSRGWVDLVCSGVEKKKRKKKAKQV